jgi:putative FmdB family regulatory protein
MPIHDYHCRSCGAAFELLVLGSSVPLCRACASPDVQRQVSLTAAPGKSAAIAAAGRRAAAREGHFSNYSAADKARLR